MVSIVYRVEKLIAKMFCQVKAVPCWLDTGHWLPHTYVEIGPLYSDKNIKDIYISSHGIRIKKGISLPPNSDEILLKNIPIRRFICKKCGKELIIFDNTKGQDYEQI